MPVHRRGRTAVRGVKHRPKVVFFGMRGRGSVSEKIADVFTNSFGTFAFLGANAALFVFWLAANSGHIPGVPEFDPYPFGMLTTMVSLEAIFLSIIVLMSQNRAAKVGDLREEVDLQVNLEVEKEVTQILKMLERLEKKLSIKEPNGKDLSKMEKVLDLVGLEKKAAKELER